MELLFNILLKRKYIIFILDKLNLFVINIKTNVLLDKKAWAKENILLSLSFTAFFFLVIGICFGTIINMLLYPLPPLPSKPIKINAQKDEKEVDEEKKENNVEVKKNK